MFVGIPVRVNVAMRCLWLFFKPKQVNRSAFCLASFQANGAMVHYRTYAVITQY
jgi:hypothetical protein